MVQKDFILFFAKVLSAGCGEWLNEICVNI